MKPQRISVSGISTIAEIMAQVFPALVNVATGLSPAERSEMLRKYHEQTAARPASEEGSSS